MDLKLVVLFMLIGAALWLSRVPRKRAHPDTRHLPASQRKSLSKES